MGLKNTSKDVGASQLENRRFYSYCVIGTSLLELRCF
jgi:hypothetical protein